MAKKTDRRKAPGAVHDASCLTQGTQREPYDEAWAMKIFREAMEEERLHPMTPEEWEREDKELRRYGVAQSKKLGLTSRDIDRMLDRHPKPQRKRESRS